MSAYLMICLHSEAFNPAVVSPSETFQNHESWEREKGWKSLLNNMQLILQPYIYFNFISQWLNIFPIPQLTLGFPRLIAKINEVNYLHYLVYLWDDFCYSSA